MSHKGEKCVKWRTGGTFWRHWRLYVSESRCLPDWNSRRKLLNYQMKDEKCRKGRAGRTHFEKLLTASHVKKRDSHQTKERQHQDSASKLNIQRKRGRAAPLWRPHQRQTFQLSITQAPFQPSQACPSSLQRPVMVAAAVVRYWGGGGGGQRRGQQRPLSLRPPSLESPAGVAKSRSSQEVSAGTRRRA